MNQPVVITPPAEQERQAPSVLLMGPLGSGKTRTVESILAAGLEVFYIATEPGFEDVFGQFAGGMPSAERLHWHYIPPVKDSMAVTMEKAKLIMKTSDQALKAMGGVNRERHNQILDFMQQCNDFEDQRTGKKYGDYSTWGPDRCLFVDGLSGLTTMAVKMKIGDKPYMEQNDYYAVQQILLDISNTLVSNSKCLFVLTAHQEYETNPVTGTQQLMASTAGKALAPVLPRNYSDAIVTKRKLNTDGSLSFYWDNVDPNATVKWRNLPPKTDHKPDFGPLIANWRAKIGH